MLDRACCGRIGVAVLARDECAEWARLLYSGRTSRAVYGPGTGEVAVQSRGLEPGVTLV